jgi:hypothetical protein
VWYRWRAPKDGKVTFDTCDSGTPLDSVLAVYTGSSLSNLSRVTDNNNDYCGGDWGAKVSFAAVAGMTYYIAVSDVGGLRENTFNLNLSQGPLSPPTVTSYTPTETTDVLSDTPLKATFSTDMDESTIIAKNLKLQVYNKKKKKWVSVAHTVGYDEGTKTATITPGSDLLASKKYRVTVTTNVLGSTGVALDQNEKTSGNQPKTWTFTTAST